MNPTDFALAFGAGVMLTMLLMIAIGDRLGLHPPRDTDRIGASWVGSQLRERLLVQTREGQTLSGALVRVEDEGLELGPWVGSDGPVPVLLLDGPAEIGGTVWIPRERVAWVQRPPSET